MSQILTLPGNYFHDPERKIKVDYSATYLVDATHRFGSGLSRLYVGSS